METTDTQLSNSIRIAACIVRQTENGMSLRNAVRQASQALGISEATVCAALTIAQDFAQDLQAVA